MSSDIPTGLLFVDEPDVPETANFLLYGPAKTGKSTAAATAPGPILWISAEGKGALSYARKIARQRGTKINEVQVKRGADTRATLRAVIAMVRADPTTHRTVVMDTIAKVRERLIGEIVVPGAKNSIQQFGEVAKILREFIEILRDEPVNLVLIAHQDVADADGDRIVQPLIGGALTQVIPGEVDVIAYTHSFKNEETGERKYVGQLVEAKGRIAGDRSGGLGAVRDLDLTEWLTAYRAALTPDDSDVPFGASAEPEVAIEGEEPEDVPVTEDPWYALTVEPLLGPLREAGLPPAGLRAAVIAAGGTVPERVSSWQRVICALDEGQRKAFVEHLEALQSDPMPWDGPAPEDDPGGQLDMAEARAEAAA